MAYYNQVFKSSDLNSPPLSGQSNSLCVLLNACLVDGYGWSNMSISSLTRSGTTATATVSAADGLKLKTGQILTISGVTGPGGGDPALYNGTFTITVASTTTFTYTMSGTPSGSATGTIVCSSKLPITSITRSGTTATVTVSNANSTLVTNDYITIEGATGGDATYYNGTFQITVTSDTTFTYTMTGTPSGSATGTLVYYKAGLQWARPFAAGTNSQTYRSADTSSNRFYLQVIDNSATAGTGKEAQIYGAEVMSADQTVTSGRFPTAANWTNGLCVRKSTTANSTVREWTCKGDGKTFYVTSTTGDGGANATNTFGFGYFHSFKSGDGYNTFIAGSGTFNVANATQFPAHNTVFSLTPSNTTTPFVVARLYSQVGGGVGAICSSFVLLASGVGGGTSTSLWAYPNGADSGFYLGPIFISDSAGHLRGRLPGLYAPGPASALSNYDEITNITGLTGVTLMYELVSSAGVIGSQLVDKWGPWT